ncbi:MurR/RpiR family transcriptional regulator [Jeotgalibaca ciconiae]|uniref:MurR/RpiR family transcriptional regulator n=1 Tax=Jeotgalibaca ciconiae TaxID=2496265 RepID=A0A3Q9BIT9_9LACT|nr:MurR/RpiR family transcriptional regulator [Jeotgalibaca ciconiae]AZP03350.1 MurR/RpiR family transcriptional regulator [Jeotgalibaca ciconiae]HJB23645.1 MurR/RpiR family transcriptional regulator [Candidatus Jeotgalibaca pullicola]
MEDLFHIEHSKLTDSEQQIVDFFNKNQQVVPFLSISEISHAIGISNSTLTRFSKKIGFKNFKELKLSFISKGEVTPSTKLQSALYLEKTEEFPNVMIYRDIQQLLETIEHLDVQSFQAAAKAIIEKKRIFVFSKGASKSLGHLLYFRLKRFGIQIQHISSSGSEIFETLHTLNEDDLLVLFFFGKAPRETNIIFDFAQKEKIDAICFSDQLYKSPAQTGTYNFYVSRGLPTEYHSLTSAISFIDSLIVEVSRIAPKEYHEQLQKMHYLKETYKKDIPR